MAKKEFWTLNDEELKSKLMDLKEELRKTRFDLKTGKERNVKKIRELKKDIARILTVLNFRKKFGKERP